MEFPHQSISTRRKPHAAGDKAETVILLLQLQVLPMSLMRALWEFICHRPVTTGRLCRRGDPNPAGGPGRRALVLHVCRSLSFQPRVTSVLVM